MSKETKILLNKERTAKSVNVTSKVDINIDNTNKPLPLNEIDTTLNAYDQYLKERKESSIYRFYGVVNGVVSNPLYNENIQLYLSGNTLTFKKINSSDIFENNGWVGYYKDTPSSIGEFNEVNCPEVFTTTYITDPGWGEYNQPNGQVDPTSYYFYNDAASGLPLRQECCNSNLSGIAIVYWDPIKERCRPWSENAPYPPTYLSQLTDDALQQFNDGVSELCDFEPFDPGYNQLNILDSDGKPNYMFKITYPISSRDITLVNNNSNITLSNGIPIIEKINLHINGRDYVGFITAINHGLNSGDNIKLYNFIDNTPTGNELALGSEQFSVFKLGNNKNDNKFRVFVLDINPADINFVLGVSTIKRIVNEKESSYYVRQFKSITTSFKDYDVYPSAYGVNYYEDDIAAFNFIKDIDVKDLRDNLNRPLSELYLTIVKVDTDIIGITGPSNTSGSGGVNQAATTSESEQTAYEGVGVVNPLISQKAQFWLDKQDNLPASIKNRFWTLISAGYTTENNNNLNYNVRAIGDPEYNGRVWYNNIDESNDLFDGDIVEYNESELLERTLEDLYHRINTIYRENLNTITANNVIINGTFNTNFNLTSYNRFNIIGVTNPIIAQQTSVHISYFDRCTNQQVCNPFSILSIQNPIVTFSDPNNDIVNPNTTGTNNLNCLHSGDNVQIIIGGSDCGTGGVEDKKEGYIYKPFNKIPIREYSSFISGPVNLQSVFDEYNITNISDQEKIKKDYGIPDYAIQISPNIYKWRDLLEIGERDSLGSGVDYPFESGSHYIHLDNRFYLQRQDPPCEFYLTSELLTLPTDKDKFLEMITRSTFFDYNILDDSNIVGDVTDITNPLNPVDVDVRFITFFGEYNLGQRDVGGACINYSIIQTQDIDDDC